jgi:hypothetical protein
MSMVMKLRMSKNQAYKSQVHVTALQCLTIKPGKKGLNRRLRPVLRGGGTGSHTLLNHVTRKQMVKMTFAKDHHAPTRRTARNFLMFHMAAVRLNENCTLLFLTGEDVIARFDSRRYSHTGHKQVK